MLDDDTFEISNNYKETVLNVLTAFEIMSEGEKD